MIRTPNTVGVALSNEVVPKDLATIVSTYFRHNWREPVIVRTEWRTLVRSSLLRHREQRIGVWSRPRITVQSSHQAMDQRQLQLMLQHTYDLGPRYTVPVNTPTTLLSGSNLFWAGAIHSDISEILEVTGGPGAGYLLTVDNNDGYRFFPNQRVWIVNSTFDDEVVDANVSLPAVLHTTTTQVNRIRIEVEDVANFVPQAGMCVVPAIDCVPALTVQGDSETALTPSIDIEAEEAIGENQMPPLFGTGIGVLFDTYQDYPIFEPDHNYREAQGWGFDREGQTFDLGNMALTSMEGERGLATSSFLISAPRADFWRFKLFFDSRRGSLLPFWVVTGVLLACDYTHAGGTTVPLLPDFSSQFTTTLAFKPQDGGDTLVRTCDVTTGGLVLNEALPAGDYDITLAYLGRFVEDFIDEEWITSSYAECRFETVEVQTDQVEEINP